MKPSLASRDWIWMSRSARRGCQRSRKPPANTWLCSQQRRLQTSCAIPGASAGCWMPDMLSSIPMRRSRVRNEVALFTLRLAV